MEIRHVHLVTRRRQRGRGRVRHGGIETGRFMMGVDDEYPHRAAPECVRNKPCAVHFRAALRTNWSDTDLKVSMIAPIKRLPFLPAERALKVISGRWKAIVLYHLFDEPRRLAQLARLLPQVTQ